MNKSIFNLKGAIIAFGKAGQNFGKEGEKGGEKIWNEYSKTLFELLS